MLAPLVLLVVAAQGHDVFHVALDESFEYAPDLAGTLFVWAMSEDVDPFLRVEEADGSTIAEDGDSGGGTTSFLRLDCERSNAVRIVVAAQAGGARRGTGRAIVHVHVGVAPETEATEAAASEAWLALRRVRAFRAASNSAEAGDALRAALERLLRVDGGETSRSVSEAAYELGVEAYHLGDYPSAVRACSRTRDFRQRYLPPDHADLVRARHVLATVWIQMGEFDGARGLLEDVLAVYERTLPEEHPNRIMVLESLADILLRLGDVSQARAIQEQVLAIQSRVLPDDHLYVQNARNALAVTLHEMGDLSRALALLESVIAVYEASVDEDDASLQAARTNRVRAMRQMGDLEGARAGLEELLEIQERTLPADHPALLRTKELLGLTLQTMGDPRGARSLFEGILKTRSRSLPDDHPDLLSVRNNLAAVLHELGHDVRARELREQVLAAHQARGLPATHRALQAAWQSLAESARADGELDLSLALMRKVLAGREAALPREHYDVQFARRDLIWILAGLEREQELAAELRRLAQDLLAWTRASLVLSPREARERTDWAAQGLATILSLSDAATVDEASAANVFELIETLRAVSTGEVCQAVAASPDPEVAALRERALALRLNVNDLVSRLQDASASEVAERSAELAQSVLQRDRVEADLRRRLVEAGSVTADVELDALARALPERTAAAGFLVYARDRLVPEEPHRSTREESLVVHVLRDDGTLVRAELGPLAPIEDAAARWRAGVGAARAARGAAVVRREVEAGTHVAGAELRARVLDPILRAAGDVDTLHLCLDGVLHLVPIDALPLEDGVVGDRLTIRREISFARLLAGDRPPLAEGPLLAVGAVDFDAQARAETATRSTALAPPVEELRGAAGAELFSPLPQTLAEVSGLYALFEQQFESESMLLTGAACTKLALFEHAPRARYLHLATHGFFADSRAGARVGSRAVRASWSSMDVERTVTGLTPMARCGLALAGANRGRDALGHVPGIVTAEEIAGLNLAACELAVLSACETSLGERGNGLGIQSLQAALHAAGARTVVTSLWKVSDAATKELMLEFYRRMWVEDEGKAEALWNAKTALRERGAPLSDWAPWILTGRPD